MRKLFTLMFSLMTFIYASSQTMKQDEATPERLKFSGYIQTQFQHGGKDASLSVGAKNENKDKSFNRIGIRRGRIKLSYEERIVAGVFQIDITDKSIGLKDAYINIKDPLMGTNSLKAGVFNRPFGDEIEYSSSSREAPERSDIFRTLFPEERDMGAMITLQANKGSQWSFLKLQAGLFAGNGIKQETDSRKDFIGHLMASKKIGKHSDFSIGTSYYHGGVYQGTANIYKMQGNGFILNNSSNNVGKFAPRKYIGFDTQINIDNTIGKTNIRAEYLLGSQPGTQLSSKSPNASQLIIADTYVRNFSGGSIAIVQNIGSTPFSAVVKYDLYDPNTKVSGNDIGLNNTTNADISTNTIGFGILWNNTDNNIRLQAYYDIVSNETSENLLSYSGNLQDNTFTLRLQYKF